RPWPGDVFTREAVEPVLDVECPAALALLAIVDDGEPRLYLPADAFGDGRAHILLQRRIDGALDTRREARMKRRRLGQAAHVRAQDPVVAALHWSPPRGLCPRGARVTGNPRRQARRLNRLSSRRGAARSFPGASRAAD